MSGGVNCAGQILDRRGLLVEMILGAQLVDPASIPPDPDDFDPVFTSRGAKLRARRGPKAAAVADVSVVGDDPPLEEERP